MLNPIEQSPAMAYEPVRQQQIVQQAPVVGETAVTPAQASALSTAGQVQQSSAGSSAGGSGGSGTQGDSSQQSNASSQLGAAWSTLSQLKHQAAAAMDSGNVAMARNVAAQAAGIAGSIRALVSEVGASDAAGADIDLQVASQVTAAVPSGVTSTSQSVSTVATVSTTTSSPLEIARAGLSTAQDVVETLQQMPGLSVTDQTALASDQQAVASASISVEATAARQSVDSPLVTSPTARSLLDIKA